MALFYSDAFQRSAKKLAKRYRSFKKDLKTFTDSLEEDPKQGTELFKGVYKVRVKNSDNNKGKRAGYRIIIYLITEDDILLVDIYAKSDLSNLSDEEISQIIMQYGKEK